MKHCAPKRQTRGHAIPHAQPANHVRALVRVDGTGIRKKIKKDYEKALRDLDNARGRSSSFSRRISRSSHAG